MTGLLASCPSSRDRTTTQDGISGLKSTGPDSDALISTFVSVRCLLLADAAESCGSSHGPH